MRSGAEAGWPGTSLRSRAASETWAAAQPLMRQLGISRVTDITRLDRLGLPVFASVRPRGLTLRVHAGKGLRVADARIGALMEAIEFAVAEAASQRAAAAPRQTLGELAAGWPDGLRVEDFAPRVGMAMDLGRVHGAVACEQLGRRAPVWLPAELVHVPWVGDGGPLQYGWSTNGLASGNTLEEATLHGLLEVLERDAMAMNLARDRSARLDNAALPEPFAAWAAGWARDGIELIVRHVPNGFGLACFSAHLLEATSLDVNLAAGAGLHPDRSIALARAVCEAAQARLSTLHGGRDDITRFYGKYDDLDRSARQQAESHLLRALTDRRPCMRFDAVPHRPLASPAGALRALLAHLRALGLACVFRHRFAPRKGPGALRGLQVVKVIVPRCESIDASGARMGPRLLAQVLGHA